MMAAGVFLLMLLSAMATAMVFLLMLLLAMAAGVFLLVLVLAVAAAGVLLLVLVLAVAAATFVPAIVPGMDLGAIGQGLSLVGDETTEHRRYQRRYWTQDGEAADP